MNEDRQLQSQWQDIQEEQFPQKKRRYGYLDLLRGVTLLNMIGYHGVWDLVYVHGVEWDWFRSDIAYMWQQSICWMFILLSGFCWSLGKRRLKRGLTVSGAGLLVSLITLIFTPQQRILFGVLTFLGASTLLMVPLERLLRRLSPAMGLVINVILFLLLRNINSGYLGFGSVNLLEIPSGWYEKGYVMTFLGFTDTSFFSTDYFSLFPWFFLFLSGYFIYRLSAESRLLQLAAGWKVNQRRPLAVLGRHSLLIYMLHQPVLYLGLMLLEQLAIE